MTDPEPIPNPKILLHKLKSYTFDNDQANARLLRNITTLNPWPVIHYTTITTFELA